MARHTLWSSTDRDEILRRFEQLPPAARPRWGKLDAPRMVTHVTDAIRSSLSELTLTPMRGPLAVRPINTLVMFYLPWPKGAPTAPELLERRPAEWAKEIETLKGAVSRFVARDMEGPWARHVAFGAITGQEWGRLMYRHMDYHLGQFGG